MDPVLARQVGHDGGLFALVRRTRLRDCQLDAYASWESGLLAAGQLVAIGVDEVPGSGVWKGMRAALRQQHARDQVQWLLSRLLAEAELEGAFRNHMLSAWAHELLQTPPEGFSSHGLQPGVDKTKYKHWTGCGKQPRKQT